MIEESLIESGYMYTWSIQAKKESFGFDPVRRESDAHRSEYSLNISIRSNCLIEHAHHISTTSALLNLLRKNSKHESQER